MRTVLALCLIAAAVWIFQAGWLKRQSLAGRTQAAMASLGEKIDGDRRWPEHRWYMVGGAVVALAGVGLLLSARRR